MHHTHNNTIAKAKRLVATALIVALCTQHATPALAITFDSTASDYFDTVEDFGLSGGSDNISVRFGTTLGEFLRFNRSADKFILSNDLDVRGTISGASLKIMGTASISGALVLEGTSTLSGGALRGFGLLTDCDTAGTSKLLWDATTGRFSCGTDQSGAGGLSLSDADARYVNTHGDTMTGKLVLDTTSIDVKGSGSIVAYDPNDIVLVVRGTGSQTANLQEWQDVNGTSIANITAGGQLGAQYGNFSSLMSTTYADVTTSLNVSGNAILGSDSTDYVAFNADVNTSINPDANVTYNLGSDSYRWNYVYGGNGDFSGEIYGAGVGNVANVTMRNITSCNGSWSLATDMNGSVYCDTDDVSAYTFSIYDGVTSESVSSGDSVRFQAGDSNISVNVSATDTVTIGFNNPGFITSESDPVYNANSYAVSMNQHVNTSSDVQFQNMNITGVTALGSDSSDTIAFNGLANTSILNNANNTYNIGDSTNRWATGFFNSLNTSGSADFNSNVAVGGVLLLGALDGNIYNSAIPYGDLTFDLGSVANKWRTAYLGSANVYGVLSGVTLYATKSFSGAGLTDCDTAGTSKLLWDATTGRFSCGTDQTGGSSGGSYFAGQGLSLNGANSFSVNATLTGSLAEFSTVSGAVVHAQSQLRSSGALVVEGTARINNTLHATDRISTEQDVAINQDKKVIFDADDDSFTFLERDASNDFGYGGGTFLLGLKNNFAIMDGDGGNAYLTLNSGNVGISTGKTMAKAKLAVNGVLSGVTLYATRSFSGAGLTDCDTGGTSKLLWDATTGRFSCGTDQGAAYTAGQGLTLNGTSFRLNAAVTGSTIHAVSRLSSSGSAIIHGNGADFTVFNSVDELKPSIIAKTVSSAASQVFLNAVTGDNAASDGLEFGNYYSNAFLMNRETAGIILGTANAYHVGINSAGSVGIGGAYDVFSDPTVDAKLEVVGTISGASVYASTSFSAPNSTLKMAGHVVPTIDGFFTLGSPSSQWFETYANYGKFANGYFSSSLAVGTTASPKAKLDVLGIMSGVTLYATKSFSGAGLTDCDTGATSKLLWDATTGRFSCGTDQTGGSSGGGMAYATASGIFLKRSGGTMTGGLTVLRSGGTTDRGITVAQHNDGIHGAPLLFMKSRGTVTSPTTVASGDYGGFFQYGFYTGGTNNDGYTRTATIATIVNGTVSTSNGGTAPTDIIFAAGSTDDPNITTTERMRITSTGNVGIATSSPHSTFTASGSFATRARVMTATGSINGHDNVIFASGSSMITVTLPTAVGIAGRQYTIKKTSATNNTNIRRVVVATTSSQTIDRLPQWLLLNRGQQVTVISDGANWQTIDASSYGLNGGFVAMGTTMNQWYGTPSDGTALTTAVLTTTATIRVLPFIAQKVMTINGMAVSVQTTAASAEVRLALYSDSGRGYPDQLVVDAGTVATTTTGVRSICPSGCTTTGAGTLPTTIQPGLYWIAINNNSIAHTLRGYAVANLNPVTGYPSNYTTARTFGWQVSNAYGAFPTTFPGTATATTAAPLPAVTMRFQE